MNSNSGASEPIYLLGHTREELERLDLQGQLYRDTTRRCLLEAGIQPGWRVLDVGSGSGDVSMLSADLVGSEGEVVGFDREPAAVAAAAERARRAGFDNIEFTCGPLAATSGQRGFDAVVGRFILMHQADPSRFLRDVTASLRPGGTVAFVESSMTWLTQGPHSFPHSELFNAVVQWKLAVVESAGADLTSGARLHRTFVGAGFPAPQLRLEAVMAGASKPAAVRYMVESVRSMTPQAARAGIENTFGPVETLEARLLGELTRTDGTITLWPTVSAWSRKEDLA